jgi:hypothetical protein
MLIYEKEKGNHISFLESYQWWLITASYVSRDVALHAYFIAIYLTAQVTVQNFLFTD